MSERSALLKHHRNRAPLASIATPVMFAAFVDSKERYQRDHDPPDRIRPRPHSVSASVLSIRVAPEAPDSGDAGRVRR